MEPVMLATDGSPTAEKATEVAIDLARVLDTELVIVSVWDIAYTAVGVVPMPVTGEFAMAGEEEARKIVAKAALRAEETGVEARTLVLRGFPVEEICGAAKRCSPRFLVLGSHGWGVVKRALFGSVSTGVLHHATCPVLVVPTDQRAEPVDEPARVEVHA